MESWYEAMSVRSPELAQWVCYLASDAYRYICIYFSIIILYSVYICMYVYLMIICIRDSTLTVGPESIRFRCRASCYRAGREWWAPTYHLCVSTSIPLSW